MRPSATPRVPEEYALAWAGGTKHWVVVFADGTGPSQQGQALWAPTQASLPASLRDRDELTGRGGAEPGVRHPQALATGRLPRGRVLPGTPSGFRAPLCAFLPRRGASAPSAPPPGWLASTRPWAPSPDLRPGVPGLLKLLWKLLDLGWAAPTPCHPPLGGLPTPGQRPDSWWSPRVQWGALSPALPGTGAGAWRGCRGIRKPLGPSVQAAGEAQPPEHGALPR